MKSLISENVCIRAHRIHILFNVLPTHKRLSFEYIRIQQYYQNRGEQRKKTTANRKNKRTPNGLFEFIQLNLPNMEQDVGSFIL